MSRSIKNVNLFPTRLRSDHSVFGKVITRSLPKQEIAVQPVRVLLRRLLFFFRDEENYLVVAFRRYDAARKRLK